MDYLDLQDETYDETYTLEQELIKMEIEFDKEKNKEKERNNNGIK